MANFFSVGMPLSLKCMHFLQRIMRHRLGKFPTSSWMCPGPGGRPAFRTSDEDDDLGWGPNGPNDSESNGWAARAP